VTIRKRAVKLVLSISDRDEEYRKIGQPPPTYQYFLCPKIEFSAKHYSDMVEITSDGVGHFYYMPAPFYAKSIKDKKYKSLNSFADPSRPHTTATHRPVRGG
jgi:hypothetical protein